MARFPGSRGILVQCPQKRGQGFAASGGGGDQDMLAGGDPRPALCLDGGRAGKALSKPCAHAGLELRQGRHGVSPGGSRSRISWQAEATALP